MATTARWMLMIRWLEILTIAVMVAVSGCAADDSAPAGSAPADGGRGGEGVTRTAEAGGVTLTVSLDKDRAAIAEPIRLTLTAVAADGVEVKWPEVAGELSGLEVRAKSVTMPVALGDGRRQWSQSYTLEGYSGGEHVIPPLVLRYNDLGQSESAGSSQPAKTGEVRSEAMSIAVASAIQGEADPKAFRDIKPLAAVHLDRHRAWLWWVAGVVVSALGLAAWIRRRRIGAAKTAEALVIAPHEWAFRELDRLAADDLVGRGRIHEFYFRLSGITREYIERRFRVSAPEMTTEEFLLQVRGARYLDEAQKQVMAKFLEACDLVKFAKYQPSSSEIDHAFNAAKDFVSRTALRPDDESGATGREAAA